MKVLLFGSAFNPPHNGHLNLINEAVRARTPDLVLLVPTGNPVHKKISDCPADSRLRMATSFAEYVEANCKVLNYEIKRKKPSYTIDTIHHIIRKYPGCEIDLLIGGDMLQYFSKWYNYTEIMRLCNIVAAVREHGDRRPITSIITAIRGLGGNADLLSIKPFVLSSGEIRDRLRSLQDCSKLVPPAVLDIIKKNKLYRPPHLRTLARHVEMVLSPKRYHHTMMVCKMAICLARINNIPTYKVCAAALLHDVAKEFSHEKMLQLIKEGGIINKLQEIPFSVLHGYAGAEYAKKEMLVSDEEILSAIRCHSTAKAGMTACDKIVYLADMVSEDRSYKEVTELRTLAMTDLDAGLLKSLELSLHWLRRDNKQISPHTLQAIEELKGIVFEKE